MHCRQQCWFYASMERIIEPSHHHWDRQPHPALMNAIYLLACHFSQLPRYTEFEAEFLVQAQWEINVALDNSDRLVDVVQASSLLAIYLCLKDHGMEGYRHVFTAARLAVGIGLHQTLTLDIIPDVGHASTPVISIPPPCDSIELRDRIFAFWQVFMVDRFWSVANGLPLALPERDNARCRILTPWPSGLAGPKLVGLILWVTIYLPCLLAFIRNPHWQARLLNCCSRNLRSQNRRNFTCLP